MKNVVPSKPNIFLELDLISFIANPKGGKPSTLDQNPWLLLWRGFMVFGRNLLDFCGNLLILKIMDFGGNLLDFDENLLDFGGFAKLGGGQGGLGEASRTPQGGFGEASGRQRRTGGSRLRSTSYYESKF